MRMGRHGAQRMTWADLWRAVREFLPAVAGHGRREKLPPQAAASAPAAAPAHDAPALPPEPQAAAASVIIPVEDFVLVKMAEFGEDEHSPQIDRVRAAIAAAMGTAAGFTKMGQIVQHAIPFYAGARALFYKVAFRADPDAEVQLAEIVPGKSYSERFIVVDDPFLDPPGEGAAEDGETRAIWLDRTNNPIYALNDERNAQSPFLGMPDLDPKRRRDVVQYLRFFFDNVRGTLGAFILLPDPEAALKWLADGGAKDRDIASLKEKIDAAFAHGRINELTTHAAVADAKDDFEKEPRWSLRALVGFKNALFATDVDVRPDGLTRLNNEELILEELPIDPDAEKEPFHDLPVPPPAGSWPRRFPDELPTVINANEFVILFGKFSSANVYQLDRVLQARGESSPLLRRRPGESGDGADVVDGDPAADPALVWERYKERRKGLVTRIRQGGTVFVRGRLEALGQQFGAIDGKFVFQKEVDLRLATFEEGLDLSGCVFFETLDLSYAKVLGDLNLATVEIRYANLGHGFTVRPDADQIDPILRLRGVEVTGDVILARLSTLWAGKGSFNILATDMKVGGGIILNGLRCYDIDLSGTHAHGDVQMGNYGSIVWHDPAQRSQAQRGQHKADANVLRMCPPYVFRNTAGKQDKDFREERAYQGTFAAQVNFSNLVARNVYAACFEAQAVGEDPPDNESGEGSAEEIAPQPAPAPAPLIWEPDDDPAEEVAPPRGILNHSIWIGFDLSFSGAKIEGGIMLQAPFVAGTLSLHAAHALHVRIWASTDQESPARLGSCQIDYAHIEGNIDFEGLEVGVGRGALLAAIRPFSKARQISFYKNQMANIGDASIQGTFIGGTFHANSRWRIAHHRPTLVAGKLLLSYSTIKHNVSLFGTKVGDAISLENANVGGNIDTTGRATGRPDDRSVCTHFSLRGVNCRGDVDLRRFVVLNPRCIEAGGALNLYELNAAQCLDDASASFTEMDGCGNLYRLSAAQSPKRVSCAFDVAALYGLSPLEPATAFSPFSYPRLSSPLAPEDFTIAVPQDGDASKREVPLEPGILAQRAQIDGALALYETGGSEGDGDRWSRAGWIYGCLDCSRARIGRLAISPLSFMRPSAEMTASDFHRRRCPVEGGRPKDDDGRAMHESFGVNLEGCEIGRFQLAEGTDDEKVPFSINLTGASVKVWDQSIDLTRLLDCDIDKFAITYRMIQHEYAARGDDAHALETYAELRRKSRHWYDRVFDLFWVHFTQPIRWQWAAFGALWFLFSWLCVFSNADNMALGAETADTLHRQAGIRPMHWSARDGWWVAMREHVPIIAVVGRFEWEPASFEYPRPAAAAEGAAPAPEQASPPRSMDSTALTPRPLIVTMGPETFSVSWLTAEGYASFVVLVFTIFWTVGIAVFAAGVIQKQAAGS
jgi:hypothetical protein